MSREKPLHRHLIEARNRPTVRSALLQLKEADELAHLESLADEEFAVRLSSLILGGSSAPAVQWLRNEGYARQVADGPRSRKGPVQPSSNGRLNDQIRVIATPSGLELAEAVSRRHEADGRPRSSAARPHWDSCKRELWFRGQLIKRYSRWAGNQILILEVFQEEKWLPYVDDPLPGDKSKARYKRLKNTVQRLNEGHLARLIRFHVDRHGSGIRWESLAGPLTKAKRQRRAR